MVSLKITSATLVLAISAAFVQGAPLRHQKRIAQVIADSTAQWEQACVRLIRIVLTLDTIAYISSFVQLAAGGGQQCNPQSIASFSTLLAAAGDCDQQNEADNMIDLAKSLNSDATMIQLTQIFVQQPRNTVRRSTIICNQTINLIIHLVPYLAQLRRCALLPAGSSQLRA